MSTMNAGQLQPPQTGAAWPADHVIVFLCAASSTVFEICTDFRWRRGSILEELELWYCSFVKKPASLLLSHELSPRGSSQTTVPQRQRWGRKGLHRGTCEVSHIASLIQTTMMTVERLKHRMINWRLQLFRTEKWWGISWRIFRLTTIWTAFA